jgi:two-component system, sensor histidine kinase
VIIVEKITIDGRAPRVLCAEDNQINQFVLKAMMEAMGVEAVIVGDGEQAVAAWERETWDLILMDIQMPILDGVDATQAIRRREAETDRPITPIFALTANVMSHQVSHYLDAGMQYFIAKPIDIPRLKEAMMAAFCETREASRSSSVARGH